MIIRKLSQITAVLTVCASGASTIVYEPSLYFSERDSPFYGGIIDNTGNGIWLEDFEDQQLNTPFVRQEDDRSRKGTTFREKFSFPGVSSIWGVDGDDGAIDGHTSAGDVWISTNTNGGGPSQIMSFQFEPNEDGNYPLYVGLVITRPNNFFSQIEVRWNDLEGNSIYDDEYDMTEWAPPEGATAGSPLLQRFVGLYHEDGIAQIFMSNVNQIDHLQYGYSIPEPSASLLTLLSLGLLTSKRRRS